LVVAHVGATHLRLALGWGWGGAKVTHRAHRRFALPVSIICFGSFKPRYKMRCSSCFWGSAAGLA
jgi:hypothetical protein